MAKTKIEKSQESKNKSHSLKCNARSNCKRMELFESLLPDTITITDEQFKTFLENAY